MIKSLIIVPFGGPGYGKDEFMKYGINFLKNKYDSDSVLVSTGDMFRILKESTSDLAKEVAKYRDYGKLVPDEITNKVVQDYLERIKLDDKNILKKNMFWNGFPRTIPQVYPFQDMMISLGIKEIDIVKLQVIPEQIVERMFKRGRDDDKIDLYLDRVKEYEEKTLPLLDVFSKESSLIKYHIHTLDNKTSLNEFFQAIIDLIQKLAERA
jgi:adenylate kinase